MTCRSTRIGSILRSVVIPGLILGAVFETWALAEVREQVESKATLKPGGFGIKDGLPAPVTGEESRQNRLSVLPGKLVVKLKPGRRPELLSMQEAKRPLRLSEKRWSNQSHSRFKDLYIVSADKQEDLATLAAERAFRPFRSWRRETWI